MINKTSKSTTRNNEEFHPECIRNGQVCCFELSINERYGCPGQYQKEDFHQRVVWGYKASEQVDISGGEDKGQQKL